MQNNTGQPWQLLIIILLEGFVTISLEILSLRQLTPVVGNNIIATSLIIGIFLLCLAFGYRAGGLLKSNLKKCLQQNFLIAALGIGLGLSYLFINSYFTYLHNVLNLSLFWALIIYLLLIIAPIVYFLGQTVPITMSILDNHRAAGELGGKVLYLSTLGSFLGSVFTSLILMNYCGLAWTVFIDASVLLILFLLMSNWTFKKCWILIIIAISLIFIYLINIYIEQIKFITTNSYANYEVIHAHDKKYLIVNDSPSSLLTSNGQGFAYIEYIKKALFQQLKISNKKILVLGAGGFTLSAAGTYGNQFTYVDIDPSIYTTVEKNFLKSIKGTFIAEDARLYVQHSKNKYDVIVNDVYSNSRIIPAHLLTREYMLSIKQALTAQGIAIFNVISSPLLNTPLSKRVDNTIHSVFKSCRAVPLQFSLQHQVNILYICVKNAEEDDQVVYTDNLNKASADTFQY